jgi:1-pyrroline-5-carboxylate dehydrogenase
MTANSFENELTIHEHTQAGTLDEFHRAYEAAVDDIRSDFGATHPLRIDGDPVETEETFTVTNPGDTDQVLGEFAAGDETHVDEAVAAASDAFDEWKETSWEERVALFREAADVVQDRKLEITALMAYENAKTRNEAIAEVDEAIDFLRYYSSELERNEGYTADMREPTPGQRCVSDLQPYGVFGVVAPFNFPFAITVGMTTGALITGNTAVVKPASTTPLTAHAFYDALAEAGIPDGVVNLVTGGGRAVGQPMIEHEDVAGFVFTGSREVGLEIQRTFDELDKRGPVVAELGGKNPVIVSDSAEISKAVSGVKFGAFSFSGQKCSATSRVYVHEDIADEFTERLVEETNDLSVGKPENRETVVSPLIDDGAIERYDDICETAAADGTVLTGGSRVDRANLPTGRYVEPTVVTDIPHDHPLATDEHFLPFVTIHPVSSLEEGITKANDSEYGLCAGLFSEDEDVIDTWFDRIESGMCYVNREQSATTGALVDAQPFGGWKYSGTTGKFAGGPWYLQQFMRQQSRTVVGDIGQP